MFLRLVILPRSMYSSVMQPFAGSACVALRLQQTMSIVEQYQRDNISNCRLINIGYNCPGN